MNENHLNEKTTITKVFEDSSHVLIILIIITVFLLHVITSWLIQKRHLKASESNLKKALWSFLSPPLFLDWDSLYRQEGNDDERQIPEYWRRTRNSFLFHNLLTLVGNLVLGIPFYLFWVQPQILDWCHGTGKCGWHLEWLLIAVIATVILGQGVLIGLGFLYFRKFHPWARILNEELARENNSSHSIAQFRWFRGMDILGARHA